MSKFVVGCKKKCPFNHTLILQELYFEWNLYALILVDWIICMVKDNNTFTLMVIINYHKFLFPLKNNSFDSSNMINEWFLFLILSLMFKNLLAFFPKYSRSILHHFHLLIQYFWCRSSQRIMEHICANCTCLVHSLGNIVLMVSSVCNSWKSKFCKSDLCYIFILIWIFLVISIIHVHIHI